MKKIALKLLLFVAVLLPISINAANKDKVKVYVFEAGGCGFCEQQVEYLKGLESYNEKFEIVRMELYVDNKDWKPGKDYDLGVKVSDAFSKVGFVDATYQATPFVVISDLYATSAYNTSLESIIDEAHEKGDKDIVSCLKDGKDDCLAHLETTDNTTSAASSSINYTWTILGSTALLIAAYLVKTTIDTNKLVEAINNINKKEKK